MPHFREASLKLPQREPHENSKQHISLDPDEEERETASNYRQYRYGRTTRIGIIKTLRSLRSMHVKLQNLWSKMIERPPEIGKARMHWTCSCGLHIYDDYLEVQPGALASLQTSLESFSCSVSQNSEAQSHSNSEQATSGSCQSIDYSSTRNSPLAQGSPDLNQVSTQDCERGEALSLTANSKVSNSESRTNPMHLILGHPSLNLATALKQPDTSDITSDKQFFLSLRQQHINFRGSFIKSLLSLHTLSEIRFVQFELWNVGIADVRKLDDLPPHIPSTGDSQLPNTGSYTYKKVQNIPPIGSATIKHLMHHHPEKASESETRLFEPFPRKLFSELKVRHSHPRQKLTNLPWLTKFSHVPPARPPQDGASSSSRVSPVPVSLSSGLRVLSLAPFSASRGRWRRTTYRVGLRLPRIR